ncbi:hypothetical protein QOZ80_5BG0424720 [Eleusine coracana subsp. coracana]|nr:hypothetical protein QOZ80_5BG0424720 [Eleusine coracana subsp. coracana]
MESLSSVNTIVLIALDLVEALLRVIKNKTRCKKLAERVQGIGDLLQLLEKVTGGTNIDAPTQRLLGRLQKTLNESLGLVRSWQCSSCPWKFITSRRMAEHLDEVDRQIDRCVIDLNLPNLILVARLEKNLHYRNEAAGDTSSTYQGPAPHGFMPYHSGPPSSHPVDAQRQFNPHRATAAFGVPLHTVTANVPEMVPPPTYGYWPYPHGHSTGCCCHHNTAGPSDPAAAYNYNHHSPYVGQLGYEILEGSSVVLPEEIRVRGQDGMR